MKINAKNLRSFVLDLLAAPLLLAVALSYILFTLGLGLLGLSLAFGFVAMAQWYVGLRNFIEKRKPVPKP